MPQASCCVFCSLGSMSHPRDVAFTRFYNRFEPKVATSSLSGQSDSFSSSAPCSPMKRVCPYAHSHEIGAKVDKSLSGTAPAVALKWHGVGLRGADLEVCACRLHAVLWCTPPCAPSTRTLNQH